MKKIILMALISSCLFAGGTNEVLENRIENELKMKNVIQIPNYRIDYDVDIYGNQMNIEIEINGITEPNLDYEKIALETIKTSKQIESNLERIYIVIKFDSIMNEDKILFSKTYSQ